MKQLTAKQWREEGLRRFGSNEMEWKFVCPSCGHVAAVSDWQQVGAPESAVAFSCVGRWMDNPREFGQKPGPCNYAGGGLFRINPVVITTEDGKAHNLFDFAELEARDES